MPRSSPASGNSHRTARLLTLLAVACAVAASVVMAATGPAAANVAAGVTWTASLNGSTLRAASGQQQIRLAGGGSAQLKIRLQNVGRKPAAVPYVRLQGSVLGLQFYVFSQRVDMTAPPGGADERTVDFDLLGLRSQAVGLIPSEVVLLDARGHELDAKPFTADVQGDANSVYGTFGIAVGLITLVLLFGALWRLFKGPMFENRWRRGIALAAPGFGLGLTLTFTTSALRWVTPEGGLWATFLLVGAGAGFAAGYLSPSPVLEDADTGARIDPETEDQGDAAGGSPPLVPWTESAGPPSR